MNCTGNSRSPCLLEENSRACRVFPGGANSRVEWGQEPCGVSAFGLLSFSPSKQKRGLQFSQGSCITCYHAFLTPQAYCFHNLSDPKLHGLDTWRDWGVCPHQKPRGNNMKPTSYSPPGAHIAFQRITQDRSCYWKWNHTVIDRTICLQFHHL